MTLFGTTTKKSGYARAVCRRRACRETRLCLDKSVSGLAKAEKADVYSYRVAAADDSPDLFVGGADLASAKQVTIVQCVPVEVRLDARGARGLRGHPRQAEDSAAGHPALPGELRGRQEVPDGGVPLREAVGRPAQFPEPVRARLLQRHRTHTERLFLLPAGHRVHAARARRVGGGVRDGRGQQGRVHGRGRRRQGRRDGPFVGRLRRDVPVDAHEAVCRRRVRRRHLESDQQLRQPPLVSRHRRDRSHRDRTAAHGRAALRGSAGLHPQLRRLRHFDDDDARCCS